jgi:hypothetical protein
MCWSVFAYNGVFSVQAELEGGFVPTQSNDPGVELPP